MTTTRYGVSAYVIACLFMLSMVLILIVSGNFSSFKSFSNPSNSEFKVPIAELRTKVTGVFNDFRAVLSENSFTGITATSSSVKHPFRSRNVVREEYEGLERGLARARASIRKAASSRNLSLLVHDNDVHTRYIYRNPGAFYQSYMEMERRFKVYVYEEGDLPIVHDGPCKEMYMTEGRFIGEIEHGKGGKGFRTRDTHRAHVYFMPFSVTWMVKYLYEPLTRDISPLKDFVGDYVKLISTKHPFWNRTHGADHFLLSCHDWGPFASNGSAQLYNTSIRVLCNANSSEGFNPQRDVSLPEVHLNGGTISPKLLSPPPLTTPRPHLAFFAGGLHGPIRPSLLRRWKNRDDDILVYEYLPHNLDYYSLMLESKFCLCPSGYEVASPRIVEAIYAECVPVILSENYVLPFSDVLRWEEFSITVEVSDIGRLKEILMGVKEEKYLRLKEGLRAVRKHFVWNQPAKRFDVFHMILHSVWLRRINLGL